MRIIDIFPEKAQFTGNETIDIRVLVDGMPEDVNSYIECSIYKLHNRVQSQRKRPEEGMGSVVFSFNIQNKHHPMSGYGVEAELFEAGRKKQSCTTAFDVLDSWKYAPRYGFLSDFYDVDDGDSEDIDNLNKYHINVLQFYDWMYRHHQLFPPTRRFKDPMGRVLNLDAVKHKLDTAHKYGMKVFAYGAVYGAGRDFYDGHTDWALYSNDGKPEMLSDFLYIMDISPSCGWSSYITNQFLGAIVFGFDGIHMDQYGFPKSSISKAGTREVIRYLGNDFPLLIDSTRQYIFKNGYDAGLIFNAVNNWPVENVAKSCEDAVYIEVWPPNDTYQDLYNLIINARKCAWNKQVILAAYIKTFSLADVPEQYKANTALLAMAAIFASGGFHLLLGEKDGVLTQAYYPSYATISSEEYKLKIRSYYDFIVNYEELIYGLDIIDCTMTYTGGINDEYVFQGAKCSPKAEPDCVWTLVKEREGYKIIHLVNHTGINNMNWNECKENVPHSVHDIEVTALVNEKIEGIYAASPDIDSGRARKLDFEYVSHGHGRAVRFTVPYLEYWDMVYIVCCN